MSVNIRKHKKKVAAVLVLGVAAAISIPLLMSGKPEEDTVREREYTVTRETFIQHGLHRQERSLQQRT